MARLHILGAWFFFGLLLVSPDLLADCQAPPGCYVGASANKCQCMIDAPSGPANAPPGTCRPEGAIRQAFLERGGCAAFGAPLTPERPRLSTGGIHQRFENGEIAVYTTWPETTATKTPAFVLSAHKDKGDIKVQWDSTAPFSYDLFNVRWDIDNHAENVEAQHEDDKGQSEVQGAGTSGVASFAQAGEGTYVIYVQGCTRSSFLFITDTDCDQGWSHPVHVDVLPRMAAPIPTPALTPPTYTAGRLLDLPDAVSMSDDQIRPILEAQCGGVLLDTEESSEDHEGEVSTSTLLAYLLAAEKQQTGGQWPCAGKNGATLRAEVNQAIRDARVVSQPGTDVAGIWRSLAAIAAGAAIGVGTVLAVQVLQVVFAAASGLNFLAMFLGGLLGGILGLFDTPDWLKDPPGDYDMRLTGLIKAAYRFGYALEPNAYQHLTEKLLTVKGGADGRKDFLHVSGVPTPVLETENHLWNTETSRYLTNHLLARSYSPTSLPKELDNDQNGMTEWILAGLQQFLVEDFYEFNSRPYARDTVDAIQNLADYAAYDVGTCRQVPLAGAAPPPTRCDVARAARNVLDYLAARFALSSSGLRRAAPFRRQTQFRDYPGLLTTGGDDLTWRYFAYTAGSDFMRRERDYQIMEGSRGQLLSGYLSWYRPHPILTDLIRTKTAGGIAPFQRFRSSRRDGKTLEVYYHTPAYLISAGGIHDPGSGMAYVFGGEDALTLPTTLMPMKEGSDVRDFVRIDGSQDYSERNNTCVAPGFACGLNPALPAGLPEACVVRKDAWVFVNFDANTKECPFDFNYFVAIYSELCDDCLSVGSRFGFFEATGYYADGDPFQKYMEKVLELNGATDFSDVAQNKYRSPTGRSVVFEVNPDEEKWGIVEYDQGTGYPPIKPERNWEKWAVAEGDVMSSPRKACLIVDSLNLGHKLIIDHMDVKRPRRAVVPRNDRICSTCPFPDSCIAPRSL